MVCYLVHLRVVVHHGVFHALQQSHGKPRHQELYRSRPTTPQTGNRPRESTSSLQSLIRKSLHTGPPASHLSYDNRKVCVPLFLDRRCGQRKGHPRSRGPSRSGAPARRGACADAELEDGCLRTTLSSAKKKMMHRILPTCSRFLRFATTWVVPIWHKPWPLHW